VRVAIAAGRAAEQNADMTFDRFCWSARESCGVLLAAVLHRRAIHERPGSHVSRADALRGCREILDGHHDELPVGAFYFTGSIDESAAPRSGFKPC